MAAVGAAGGIWHEGGAGPWPERTVVVFAGADVGVDAGTLPAKALHIRLDPEAPGALDLETLIAEGGVLVGLTGLRRHWKVLWRDGGASRVGWAPGRFLSIERPGVLGRYRVGDLRSDYVAATLAHAHLLFGSTLVFDGPADPPALVAYGTLETGLVSYGLAGSGPADSVGRPFPGTEVWIVGRDGTLLPPGAVGDIWVGHPDVQPSPGVPAGVAATGHRGFLDDEGWLFLSGDAGPAPIP